MLLKTFKSNRTVNFFLFPLVGLLFWVKNLVSPQTYNFYQGESENLLYFPIHNLLNDFPFVQNMLAFGILILLAFFMLQINNSYNFIRIRTMLPVPLFIIIVSGVTDLQTLHPVYFGAFFFLVAIYRLFSAFDQVKPYSSAFDTGFFLGIATLFYFSFFIMFPAFLIGIGILSRETRWREFAISVTGFFLPFIFAFAYSFYTGQVLELLKTFELNVMTENNFIISDIPLQVYLVFLLILTLFGSIKLIRQYDTKKVSSRKFYTFFFLIFLCSLVGFFIIPATSQEMLVVAAIPLTFLIGNFLVFIDSRFWGELWFSFLLIIVVSIQFL